MDRVVVFIDYQNIHSWARRQFLLRRVSLGRHVRPLEVGEVLVGRRKRPSHLEQVSAYRGDLTPSDSRARRGPTIEGLGLGTTFQGRGHSAELAVPAE